MKKLTKDCYVDVAGWTDEEVQKAAEVFANLPDCFADSSGQWLEVDLEDKYHYLMLLMEGEVFVGCKRDLESHGRYIEVTKEDIFNQEGQSVKEFKEGDRVMFANENFEWFGEEFCVAEVMNASVHVIDGACMTYIFAKHNLEVIEEEEPVEWSGEGLPPVGSLVEYQSFTGEWRGSGKVFHVIEKTGNIFIEYENGGWDNGDDLDRLRPVKTEEEIFAEELQKDVQEMTGHGISDKMVRTLYVLNYRKQS